MLKLHLHLSADWTGSGFDRGTGRMLRAAALLLEGLHCLPPDCTDHGSSRQLKELLPLLASVAMVRMRWELVGAGASPRNRTCPRTTTEPFLQGEQARGSSEPPIPTLTPTQSQDSGGASATSRQGSLGMMPLWRECSPSQEHFTWQTLPSKPKPPLSTLPLT